MIYGIIAISLLVLVLFFLLLKRLSKEKRIKVLKYGGISLGIAIVVLIIFNLGYYKGSEDFRKIIQAEQACDISICSKVLIDNDKPQEIIETLFIMKTAAFINNIEYENQPFYEKLYTKNCFQLIGWAWDENLQGITSFTASKLCIDIDLFQINNKYKEALKERLKISVEPYNVKIVIKQPSSGRNHQNLCLCLQSVLQAFQDNLHS